MHIIRYRAASLSVCEVLTLHKSTFALRKSTFSVVSSLFHGRDYANGFNGYCTVSARVFTDRELGNQGHSRILNGFRTFSHG